MSSIIIVMMYFFLVRSPKSQAQIRSPGWSLITWFEVSETQILGALSRVLGAFQGSLGSGTSSGSYTKLSEHQIKPFHTQSAYKVCSLYSFLRLILLIMIHIAFEHYSTSGVKQWVTLPCTLLPPYLRKCDLDTMRGIQLLHIVRRHEIFEEVWSRAGHKHLVLIIMDNRHLVKRSNTRVHVKLSNRFSIALNSNSRRADRDNVICRSPRANY